MLAEPESNPPRRRPPDGIYAYTAREWDPETNLYYYRARYYDPKVGRFLSEDPTGFSAGVNFYEYAGNSPASKIDPTGLFKVDPCCAKSGKWSDADTAQVTDWCQNLDRIPDAKLRACVEKSCKKGTIKCRTNEGEENCRTSYEEYGGSRSPGYACRRWFGRTCRTAYVCVDNLKSKPYPPGYAGWVVIHEWQHGCGWGSRGSDDASWHPPGGAPPPRW
jgi:RHS repeat-associated protein